MEYVVCVKAVPDENNEEIRLDKSGCPAFAASDMVGSAFDRCALEMAVRIKEISGGRVTAASFGEETSRGILKNCVAVGADHGIWIRGNQTADTVKKARIMAEMVRQTEKEQGNPFGVILCGVESTDRGGGVFGPALAEFLGRPYVMNVRDMKEDGNGILVTKETETGYEILKVPVPAVVMVTKTEFNPRYPTLKSKMAARKAEIAEWAGEQLDDVLCVEYTEAPKKQAGTILNMEPEQAVKEAMELMKAWL